MTGMLVSFILDIVVAGLLCITIAYCWRLNGRIRVLQDSKGELAQLIRQFDESTQRASQGITELQTTGKKVTDSIAAKIEKANYIADDLSFMIDKGAKIADQMEQALVTARTSSRPASMDATRTAPQQPAQKPIFTPAGAAPQQQKVTPAPDKFSGLSNQTKAASSLESVLDRISGRSPETTVNTFADSPKKPVPGATARLRSKAEQELFDALKSNRQ